MGYPKAKNGSNINDGASNLLINHIPTNCLLNQKSAQKVCIKLAPALASVLVKCWPKAPVIPTPVR